MMFIFLFILIGYLFICWLVSFLHKNFLQNFKPHFGTAGCLIKTPNFLNPFAKIKLNYKGKIIFYMWTDASGGDVFSVKLKHHPFRVTPKNISSNGSLGEYYIYGDSLFLKMGKGNLPNSAEAAKVLLDDLCNKVQLVDVGK